MTREESKARIERERKARLEEASFNAEVAERVDVLGKDWEQFRSRRMLSGQTSDLHNLVAFLFWQIATLETRLAKSRQPGLNAELTMQDGSALRFHRGHLVGMRQADGREHGVRSETIGKDPPADAGDAGG